MYDSVQCEICGEELMYVNHNHLRMHGYSVEEYMREFPLSPLQCQQMVEDRKYELLGRQNTPQQTDTQLKGIDEWWESPEGQKTKETLHLRFGRNIP